MTSPVSNETRVSIVNRILSEEARKLIDVDRPARMSYVRIGRELESSIAENPQILHCTMRSIALGLARGVRWNLELGKTWFLIPEVITIIDDNLRERRELRATAVQHYHGQVKLMQRRKDLIKRVDYSCVYENEDYKVRRGTDPMIEHWSIMDRRSRGMLVGGYALVEWVAGGFMIAEMDRDEVDAVRQKYSQKWRAGEIEDLPWYVEKTAVHRLAKRLDLDELQDDSDAPRELDEREDLDASGTFASIDASPVIAPGSPEEKRLLAAAGNVTRRPGARAPLSSMGFEPGDPYGLESTPESGARRDGRIPAALNSDPVQGNAPRAPLPPAA